jgi:glycine cleavage system H lipoate-binding protein
MAPTTKHHVIPEGELHCIWMEAGLIDYKLCDRNYVCEECAFDSEMRKLKSEIDFPDSSEKKTIVKKHHNAHTDALPTQSDAPAGSQTANEYFSRLCDEEARAIFKQSIPNDRRYFRNHTWLKFETPSVITMGIDHVGAHFLQQMVSVVLPETPTQIERNSPFVWIVFREGTIGLRSGVQGTVMETNGELLDHPMLLIKDPYNAGWILKISVSANEQQTEYAHNKNLSTLRADLAGIKSNFMISFQHELVHSGTQYDGGKPLRAIHEIIGEKKYFEIVNNFLSRST